VYPKMTAPLRRGFSIDGPPVQLVLVDEGPAGDLRTVARHERSKRVWQTKPRRLPTPGVVRPRSPRHAERRPDSFRLTDATVKVGLRPNVATDLALEPALFPGGETTSMFGIEWLRNRSRSSGSGSRSRCHRPSAVAEGSEGGGAELRGQPPTAAALKTLALPVPGRRGAELRGQQKAATALKKLPLPPAPAARSRPRP
jgi:hypothetical protein